MNKSDLLEWLDKKHRDWEALIEEIDPARMEEPDVVGFWSMKDFIGHMVGWNRRNVEKLQAALRNEAEPATPWPSTLTSDDEINAWFFERNRERPVSDLLADERQVHQELVAVVEGFPEDVPIETVNHEGREFYFILWNGKRQHPGEFFDHYRDDHEADIRAWIDSSS